MESGGRGPGCLLHDVVLVVGPGQAVAQVFQVFWHPDRLKQFVFGFVVWGLRSDHFKLSHFFLHFTSAKNLSTGWSVLWVDSDHRSD